MQGFKNPQTIERALTGIASDRRHGASELAVKALRVFVLARPDDDLSVARYMRSVKRLAKRFKTVRPTMAPIQSAVERLVFDFAEAPLELETAASAYAKLREVSDGIAFGIADARQRTAKHFIGRFARLKRPMVISYSSGVLTAIDSLRKPQVTVCESRPLMEGRRTAMLLKGKARSVTIITESQVGVAMTDCDGVILGCDSIQPDGSIVNKSGSYLLALAARDHRRPVVVIGDTYKLCDGKRRHSETQAESQVWRGRPVGIHVRNEVFESVPARLVDYVVLENGIFKSERIRSVWAKARKNRATL